MKIKGYVYAKYAERYDFESGQFKNGWAYEVWPCQSETWGVLISEVEVEAPTVDETELAKGQVKIMREQQQKIRAEAELKFQQIEESIQKMLCLEHKTEAA